uniref:small monomeric GTPase n=1 Tax=Oryzias latipes TaxID=8090 RepID=A0A3P9MD96_ORYLA
TTGGPGGPTALSVHAGPMLPGACALLPGHTILVGDSGVGKTSLLVQFDQGKFISGSFSATVGIGLTNKVVTVDDTKVKLQIWDTAGQERFRSVTHAYYRDAHALLLLYDITSKSSFDNIRAWLTEIHEYAQSDVVIMLLGNKADMSSERAIRRDEGERLAREYSVPFMETSAKTGVNVELAFTAIAKYVTVFPRHSLPAHSSLKIRNKAAARKITRLCAELVQTFPRVSCIQQVLALGVRVPASWSTAQIILEFYILVQNYEKCQSLHRNMSLFIRSKFNNLQF